MTTTRAPSTDSCDSSDPDRCGVCYSHKASIKFHQCAHSLCPACLEMTYIAACATFPSGNPGAAHPGMRCPFCRETITEVVPAEGTVSSVTAWIFWNCPACRVLCHPRYAAGIGRHG